MILTAHDLYSAFNGMPMRIVRREATRHLSRDAFWVRKGRPGARIRRVLRRWRAGENKALNGEPKP